MVDVTGKEKRFVVALGYVGNSMLCLILASVGRVTSDVVRWKRDAKH